MGVDEYIRQKERENSSQLFVENLLKDGGFTVEKIASLANVTIEFVNEIKNGVKVR